MLTDVLISELGIYASKFQYTKKTIAGAMLSSRQKLPNHNNLSFVKMYNKAIDLLYKKSRPHDGMFDNAPVLSSIGQLITTANSNHSSNIVPTHRRKYTSNNADRMGLSVVELKNSVDKLTHKLDIQLKHQLLYALKDHNKIKSKHDIVNNMPQPNVPPVLKKKSKVNKSRICSNSKLYFPSGTNSSSQKQEGDIGSPLSQINRGKSLCQQKKTDDLHSYYQNPTDGLVSAQGLEAMAHDSSGRQKRPPKSEADNPNYQSLNDILPGQYIVYSISHFAEKNHAILILKHSIQTPIHGSHSDPGYEEKEVPFHSNDATFFNEDTVLPDPSTVQLSFELNNLSNTLLSDFIYTQSCNPFDINLRINLDANWIRKLHFQKRLFTATPNPPSNTDPNPVTPFTKAEIEVDDDLVELQEKTPENNSTESSGSESSSLFTNNSEKRVNGQNQKHYVNELIPWTVLETTALCVKLKRKDTVKIRKFKSFLKKETLLSILSPYKSIPAYVFIALLQNHKLKTRPLLEQAIVAVDIKNTKKGEEVT
eukprot:jgi/Psemu1/8371/gm1.8371_g